MSAAESTHTLDHLSAWTHAGPSLAVLGHPIRHSVSPAMHNAALAALAARDPAYAAWKYFRFEVPPAELAAALPRFHAAGFHGLNLTVPHKILAFDLVAEIDPSATAIGAVNTLLRTATGWRGYNTDGHGLAAALHADLGVDLAGADVVLLGAGGAARGAAVECLRKKCASLWIANRTRANLDALLAALRPLAGTIPVYGFDPVHPPAALPAGAVVINATSAGLKPGEPAPIALPRLPAGLRVYDMVYNPPQTALLRDAAARGLSHANGLSMLVHQGARSLEIWTGVTAPVSVMHAAATAALA
ncbi:Shikimate dehydrogenase [Lacunisphaera limnophila]|uniref:Shikimate dehydrogenase (NADP(+)) n=1 Tax=Lacunisphaera limnophila TaxID=1838286 RepID=A0A1D8ASN9_9BACT|nr:shikimate dehydrogenase [Lacunisphaera limnophila]AOS43918.1 Shikimate dehydrogenase [Lacunisphaera limnophila]